MKKFEKKKTILNKSAFRFEYILWDTEQIS